MHTKLFRRNAPCPAVRSRVVTPWVPVRSLGPRHRRRIADHLLALNAQDRYLRFGRAASDRLINSYVAGIDFERDSLSGIFNRRLSLIAVSHLAYGGNAEHARSTVAEFGVSVDGHARGRGFGAKLFDHAVMRARNHGADRLFIHALSENTAMLKIARSAGAVVVRDRSESDAWLELPPDDMASRITQIVTRHVAEANYQLKRHAMKAAQLLQRWRRVRQHLVWSREPVGR